MRTLIRLSWIAGPITAFAVICVNGAILAGAFGYGPSGPAQPASRLPHALRTAFVVLRRDTPSALTPPPREELNGLETGHGVGATGTSTSRFWRLDVRAIRETELPDGIRLWLLPGVKGSCVLRAGPSGSGAGCTSDVDLEKVGSESYSAGGGRVWFIGIVPAGTHVRFRLLDGSTVPAVVNADGAYAEVPPLSDSVTATIVTRGRTTLSTPAP